MSRRSTPLSTSLFDDDADGQSDGRSDDDPYTRYAEYDEYDDKDDQPPARRRGRRRPSGPRLAEVGRSGRTLVDLDGADDSGRALDDQPTDPGSPLSSYDVAERGPQPPPDWLIGDLNARDTTLGVLKSGKEADVSLLDRSLPGGPGCLLAVKTYRSAEHRMFHRDAGYQEGRRTRRSRETRAMANRTAFGRELLAGQWARAEFAALCTVWSAGGRVPYPVQLIGSEVMMEFVGDPDGTAAPRLAAFDADTDTFTDLWHDLVATLEVLAETGCCHGDLSPYNILVTDAGCTVIDLPQVVDVVANPQGLAFLERDCARVGEFFARRGVLAADASALTDHLWVISAGHEAAPAAPLVPLPPVSEPDD